MRYKLSICIPALVLALAGITTATSPEMLTSIGAVPGTAEWLLFNNAYTGDWQQYGQLFTTLQSALFSRIFLLIVTLVPALFLVHYIIIGPKKFDHQGPQVYYFSLFTRIVHWVAALSFTLLVITGLMMIFGNFLGGGTPVMAGRTVHILSALVFTASVLPMFLIWVKDMLLAAYDILWFFILGGYLSKKKKPVPAGKFNAGQKIWFWLATAGGGVMAWSGYTLWSFQGGVELLRQMAIIHNLLGAAMTALFIVHLYMSLFAISGAIRSMISGYKPLEEVEILHSRYQKPGVRN